MKEQMELFMDGGLRDEGGTIDPVSGNDVPVGSTQEEVRDDIPAQLSEGEFVLPADVVRYHGLEKIMELRDEAKAGLQRMEAMGQMGNSEEAIIPDGVPFDMDDLETEDDGREYQVGGYVAPPSPFGVNYQQGAAGPQQYTSQFAGYAQQPATQPAVVAPPPPPPPTQQFTPISTKTAPDFGTFVTPRYVTYVDANGNTIQIPVDENGNPLIPVPAGYSPQGQTASTPTTPETTPSTGTGAPETFTSEGGDEKSPEQIRQEQEYKELVNARLNAAEELGYTKKAGLGQTLLGLSPLGGLAGNPEIGTVLADGTIADGQGNSFDPITGKQVGFSGGIAGQLAGALGLRDRVTPEDVAKNIPEASYAGLMSVAGNKSIEDLLDSLEQPVTDITETATKAEDITKTAQDNQAQADAAAGVGVESAQVRAEGQAVDEVAQMENIAQTANALMDMGVGSQDALRAAEKAVKEGVIDADVAAMFGKPGAAVTETAVGQTLANAVQTSQQDDSTPSVSSPQAMQSAYEREAGVPDFVKSTPSRASTVSTRSTSTGRPDIPSLTASERADMEAAEDEGGSAFDAYGQAFDRNYDSARNRGYSDSGAREYAANKTDADREAQEQTGNPNASAVTSSDGTAVRSGSGSVVTSGNTSSSSDDGDSTGSCVIATHGVSTGGFSLRDKAKAEIWCEKTYHGKWYGEAFRRGYRYYANRAVQKGVAHEYYSEFKNFVACGRGLKTDVKSKLNYYRRTVQFFVTGLFVQ